MNTAQFSLFDQAPEFLPRIDWRSQVYSKEYNTAISAMLIDACRQQPKSTAELHHAQLAEFGLGETPLGCQLAFLAETGKLRRKVDKDFVSTWSAA